MAVHAEIVAGLHYFAPGNSAQVAESAGNVFAEIEAANIANTAENGLQDNFENDVDSVDARMMAE
ncbi:hypothetical protein ZIOFF_013209 [Zingiber officinale]|uniref:Uncharacterized protein n=1 Tax=Zingiber officinale TaxID=94328 RepID=A0A8J5HU14_ZINOF|nr:hypothetical protein ZIOFF_013209 [Zingiber officinale]